MSVREYIGARYVPVFADPIEWDGTLSYEPLTVVKYQGASYVSRQWVPEGIQLDNTQYWILWADYNAQLEAYRQEVLAFDGRITTNADEIAAIKAANWVTNVRIADNAVTTRNIADEAVTGAKIADYAIDSGHLAEDSVTAFAVADGAIGTNGLMQNAVKLLNMSYKNMVVIGDSFSTESFNPVETAWYTIVAKQLGLTVRNFARNGAGYVAVGSGGLDFYGEAQAAVADTSFDNDDVKLVIIYGGTNDMTVDRAGQITSKASTLFSYIKSAFSNALIVCMGINHGSSSLWVNPDTNQTQVHYSLSLSNVARTNGIVYIPCWHWLWDSACYGSNNHPNETGNRATAFNLLNTMFGSGLITPSTKVYSGSNENGSYSFTALFTQTAIIYQGSYTLGSAATRISITTPDNVFNGVTGIYAPTGIVTVYDVNNTGFLLRSGNEILGRGDAGKIYFFTWIVNIY